MYYWLLFFRPHTANFNIALALIGFLLGGGTPFSPEFWLWALVGFLLHLTGFGHNNLADYDFDIEDPNKAHFPLVSQHVGQRDAITVTMIIACFFTLLAGYLSNPLSLIAVAGVLVSGFGYNHFNKKYPDAIVLAAISSSMLTLAAFLAGPKLSVEGFAFAVFVLATVLFHYIIGGAGKDLESDKVNFLKKYGAKLEKGVLDPGNTVLFLLGTAIVAAVSLASMTTEVLSYLGLLMVGIAMMLNHKWFAIHLYDRHDRMKKFFVGYVLNYLGSVLVISPYIGVAATLFLLLYFPIWHVLWTRYLFGNWVRPKV